MIQNSEPEPDPPSEQCRTQDGPGSNPVRIMVCIDLDKVLPLELLSNPGYGFFEGHGDQRESRISAVSGL